MFKISQSNSFSYPVTVSTLLDGGRIHKQNFGVTFRRPTSQEVSDWKARLLETSQAGHEAFSQCQRELAHGFVEGWSDVRNESGDEVLFSSTTLTQLLDIHPVPTSISDAWLEAVNGGAKAKN